MTLLQNRAPRSEGCRLLALVACLVFLGSAGQTLAQGRYTYSEDGGEVTDTQTGLIWRRCSEGQRKWDMWTRYDRRCTNVKFFTHEQALAHAKSQVGWRLPNVKEQASLLYFKRGLASAIDPEAFPDTLSHFFWTSTPYPAQEGFAMSVSFAIGSIQHDSRSKAFPIRLVR